jgi:deazaflavin-dependent oxidoreductase (nitroreductase family)
MKTYRQSHPLQRLVRRSAATRPLAKLYGRIQQPLDRFAYRLTGGRAMVSSWLSGIEVSMLTTIGAKSGRPRTLPVLALPDGEDVILIASNFGRPRHPSWYHNLRVDPHATIVTGGVSREFVASELSGADRERCYARAEEIFPPFTQYPRWAGTREIPVLRLQASGAALGASARVRPGAIGLLALVLAVLASAAAASRAAAIVPLGQFGDGPGDQAGLLSSPAGVGVDPSGRVYVSEGEWISVFSPQGPFLRAFGKDVAPGNGRTRFEQCTSSCKAGEPGGLDGAAGLAVDADGVLYVSEEGNRRVSLYTREGTFVGAFGQGVNRVLGAPRDVCSSRCGAGVLGDAAGALGSPFGVAVDRAGNLYVSEALNRRVSLTISVPWSAQVRLRGRGIRPLTRQVEFAGRTRLPVRPTRAAMRSLRVRGQIRVRAKVTYWPWGGEPRTMTRGATLRWHRP